MFVKTIRIWKKNIFRIKESLWNDYWQAYALSNPDLLLLFYFLFLIFIPQYHWVWRAKFRRTIGREFFFWLKVGNCIKKSIMNRYHAKLWYIVVEYACNEAKFSCVFWRFIKIILIKFICKKEMHATPDNVLENL